MGEGDDLFAAIFPHNSRRRDRQNKLDIRVIVGNPPWSAGQRSSADDNPNVSYPVLEARVAETYVARSTATLKNSLYDMYKMANRWASDRIGDQGVIAFVTNGSWIDGNADSGIRACLAEEFTSVHVLNLRGNARTSGERRRAEGGNAFDQGSRAPVSITVLVRNAKAKQEGCRILYSDIGDNLTRKQKLSLLTKSGSIASVDNWQTIVPDRHHDWIGHRDEAFAALYPIGSREAKAGKADEAIFRLFSNGYKTSRDAYLYNFSREACARNGQRVVEEYLGALQEWTGPQGSQADLDAIIGRYSSGVRWDRELRNNLRRCKATTYFAANIWSIQYRPFVKQHCYVDYVLVNNKYQMDKIFPLPNSDNRAICVPGVGTTKPFSALMVDSMPDLALVSTGQCFPRYRYVQPSNSEAELFDVDASLERIDNISYSALNAFRRHYADETITRDAIFDYVYGVLHAPDYRKRFANDLTKGLPRIPMAPDFYTFVDAGRALARLHLEYEDCSEYPLEIELKPDDVQPEHFRLGTRAMRFADDAKSILIVNDHVRLSGIPAEARRYVVNGRTPLGWFIDRYRVKTDKHSGITNDPNSWFDDPRDVIAAIRKIVHVSVETVAIVTKLPCPFAELQERPSREIR